MFTRLKGFWNSLQHWCVAMEDAWTTFSGSGDAIVKKPWMDVFAAAILFEALALGAGPAKAGLIISDAMYVYDPAGAIIASLEVSDDGDGLLQLLMTGDVQIDPAMVDVISFVRDPASLALSDVFGLACVGGGDCQGNPHYLAFVSNIDPNPLVFDPHVPFTAVNIVEISGGGPYDATPYLSPDWRNSGYRAAFYSYGEVPEPSTIALISMALLSLFGFGLMRRRSEA